MPLPVPQLIEYEPVLLLAGTLIDDGAPGGKVTTNELPPTVKPLQEVPLQALTS